MTYDTNTIAADLATAEQDFALWQRLTSAESRVTQLRKDYAKAKAADDRANAAAAKEADAARFAGLSNIRVTASGERETTGGLLGRAFTITWTSPVHDMYSGESQPRQHTITGFASLPAPVYDFLVERHPSQIPAEIMALAPGNPAEAMHRYFVAKRRGYLTSATTDAGAE